MAKRNDRESADGEDIPMGSEGLFVFSADPLTCEIQKKVVRVFDIFDVGNQKAVDVREIGTMCRALDLYPTEADVHEVIGAVEEPTIKGLVKMNNFVRYKLVPMDRLIKAFRNIDRKKELLLDPKIFKDKMMREGEPLAVEEADEMMSFGVSEEDNLFNWQDYVEKLYRVLMRK